MTTIEMKDALPLTAEEVRRMNAYWHAANYLSVGQINAPHLLSGALRSRSFCLSPEK